MPTAANAGYYAEIVRERAVLRRLIEAGTKVVQLGYGAVGGAGGDVDEVVDRAQAAVYEVVERRTSEDYVPLETAMMSTLAELEAIEGHNGELSGVPTGFRDLDELTNGLHAGQLIVIAGRPGLGKSTLGLDFLRNASIKHSLAVGAVLARDGQERDHDAAAVGRGPGAAAADAHRPHERRRLEQAGPPDG